MQSDYTTTVMELISEPSYLSDDLFDFDFSENDFDSGGTDFDSTIDEEDVSRSGE